MSSTSSTLSVSTVEVVPAMHLAVSTAPRGGTNSGKHHVVQAVSANLPTKAAAAALSSLACGWVRVYASQAKKVHPFGQV